MNSQRCSSCGFINFSNAEVCKRCNQNLHSSSQTKNFKKLSTVCPKCNSNHTQSFQMAYQTGTSVNGVQVTSFNSETGVSVSGGNASNQTLLASNVQPPIEPNQSIEFLAFFVLLLVFSLVALVIAIQISILIGVFSGCFTVLGLVGFYIWRSKEMNRKTEQYQLALNKWLKSWVCLRCGASWKV